MYFFLYVFFVSVLNEKPCELCLAEFLLENDCSSYKPDDQPFWASSPSDCQHCSNSEVSICGNKNFGKLINCGQYSKLDNYNVEISAHLQKFFSEKKTVLISFKGAPFFNNTFFLCQPYVLIPDIRSKKNPCLVCLHPTIQQKNPMRRVQKALSSSKTTNG